MKLSEIEWEELPLDCLLLDAKAGDPNSIEIVDDYFCWAAERGESIPKEILLYIATRLKKGRKGKNIFPKARNFSAGDTELMFYAKSRIKHTRSNRKRGDSSSAELAGQWANPERPIPPRTMQQKVTDWEHYKAKILARRK